MKLRQCWVGAWLLGLSALAYAQDSPRIWRVCVSDTVAPPYLLNDPTRPGLLERMLVDAGRSVGFSVLLLRYPSKRCHAMMVDGAVDSSLAAETSYNRGSFQFPAKAGVLDASRRLARVNVVLIRRDDSPIDWDGHKLLTAPPSVVVGTRAGLHMADDALQKIPGVSNDNGAITTRALLEKLRVKRLDLVALVQEDAAMVLGEPEFSHLVVLPRPLVVQDYFAIVQRDLPAELQQKVEAWWSAMARLRETPAYSSSAVPAVGASGCSVTPCDESKPS